MIKEHGWWNNNICEAFSTCYVSFKTFSPLLHSPRCLQISLMSFLLRNNMDYKSWQIHLWGITSGLIFRIWNRIYKLRHRIINWMYVCSKRICKFRIINFNNMVPRRSISPECNLFILIVPCNKCLQSETNKMICNLHSQKDACIYSPWSAVTRRSLLTASVQSEASWTSCLLLHAAYSGNLFRKGTFINLVWSMMK